MQQIHASRRIIRPTKATKNLVFKIQSLLIRYSKTRYNRTSREIGRKVEYIAAQKKQKKKNGGKRIKSSLNAQN